MLILTRRVGESIKVGDDVTVTVFEVRGDAVRIGIDAPRSVSVHRQEVYEELQRTNVEAGSTSDAAIDALRSALAGNPEKPAASNGSEGAQSSGSPEATEPRSDH